MDPAARVCDRFRTKAMVDGGEVLVRTQKALTFPYCWCTRTLTDLGPDGGVVALERCLDPHRGCFEERASAERES